MKKLIFLISTVGKSAKQISDEAWEAFQKYNKVKQEVGEEKKIPEGFSKCEVCGEYNGRTKMENLNQKDSFVKIPDEEYISVPCLYRGILCLRCKKNKINRPISNSYDEKNNKVWHNSYLSGMRVCDECRKELKNTAI